MYGNIGGVIWEGSLDRIFLISFIVLKRKESKVTEVDYFEEGSIYISLTIGEMVKKET